MQGMNFGADGPMITGWWVNPQTGDKFNAIDTYFEDNNLLIKTADGRLLNYDQIQNYVQTDKPDSIEVKPQTAQPAGEEIPPEVLSEIEDGEGTEGLLIPDDNIYGRPTKQAPAQELGNIYKGQPAPAKTSNWDIIDRALASKSVPTIEANVWWSTFPQREIEMLKDIMNIPEEEIVQYYINSIAVDDIMDIVKDGIREYINKNLHPVDEAKSSSVKPTPAQPAKIDLAKVPLAGEEKPKKTKKKVNG